MMSQEPPDRDSDNAEPAPSDSASEPEPSESAAQPGATVDVATSAGAGAGAGTDTGTVSSETTTPAQHKVSIDTANNCNATSQHNGNSAVSVEEEESPKIYKLYSRDRLRPLSMSLSSMLDRNRSPHSGSNTRGSQSSIDSSETSFEADGVSGPVFQSNLRKLGTNDLTSEYGSDEDQMRSKSFHDTNFCTEDHHAVQQTDSPNENYTDSGIGDTAGAVSSEVDSPSVSVPSSVPVSPQRSVGETFQYSTIYDEPSELTSVMTYDYPQLHSQSLAITVTNDVAVSESNTSNDESNNAQNLIIEQELHISTQEQLQAKPKFPTLDNNGFLVIPVVAISDNTPASVPPSRFFPSDLTDSNFNATLPPAAFEPTGSDPFAPSIPIIATAPTNSTIDSSDPPNVPSMMHGVVMPNWTVDRRPTMPSVANESSSIEAGLDFIYDHIEPAPVPPRPRPARHNKEQLEETLQQLMRAQAYAQSLVAHAAAAEAPIPLAELARMPVATPVTMPASTSTAAVSSEEPVLADAMLAVTARGQPPRGVYTIPGDGSVYVAVASPLPANEQDDGAELAAVQLLIQTYDERRMQLVQQHSELQELQRSLGRSMGRYLWGVPNDVQWRLQQLEEEAAESTERLLRQSSARTISRVSDQGLLPRQSSGHISTRTYNTNSNSNGNNVYFHRRQLSNFTVQPNNAPVVSEINTDAQQILWNAAVFYNDPTTARRGSAVRHGAQGRRPDVVSLGLQPSRIAAVRLCEAMAPPKWQSRQEFNSCFICTYSFAAFRPGHHCRNCGFLVCTKCSNKQWPSSMLPATYFEKEASNVSSSSSSSQLRVRVCHGCQYVNERFMDALRSGNHARAMALFATGNVNLRNPFGIYETEEYPIHACAQGGNVTLMRWLLDDRCCPLDDPLTKVKLTTASGLTAFAVACKYGHRAMMSYLIMEKECSVTEVTDLRVALNGLHVAIEGFGPVPYDRHSLAQQADHGEAWFPSSAQRARRRREQVETMCLPDSLSVRNEVLSMGAQVARAYSGQQPRANQPIATATEVSLHPPEDSLNVVRPKYKRWVDKTESDKYNPLGVEAIRKFVAVELSRARTTTIGDNSGSHSNSNGSNSSLSSAVESGTSRLSRMVFTLPYEASDVMPMNENEFRRYFSSPAASAVNPASAASTSTFMDQPRPRLAATSEPGSIVRALEAYAFAPGNGNTLSGEDDVDGEGIELEDEDEKQYQNKVALAIEASNPPLLSAGSITDLYAPVIGHRALDGGTSNLNGSTMNASESTVIPKIRPPAKMSLSVGNSRLRLGIAEAMASMLPVEGLAPNATTIATNSVFSFSPSEIGAQIDSIASPPAYDSLDMPTSNRPSENSVQCFDGQDSVLTVNLAGVGAGAGAGAGVVADIGSPSSRRASRVMGVVPISSSSPSVSSAGSRGSGRSRRSNDVNRYSISHSGSPSMSNSADDLRLSPNQLKCTPAVSDALNASDTAPITISGSHAAVLPDYALATSSYSESINSLAESGEVTSTSAAVDFPLLPSPPTYEVVIRRNRIAEVVDAEVDAPVAVRVTTIAGL